MSAFLDDCLSREVILVTGKGGVGKSTIAWAIARAVAARGKRVAVASWNPLEEGFAEQAPAHPSIRWLQLDASSCFREYASRILKFETLYNVIFENYVLQTFLKATPGVSDTVIAGKLWDVWNRGDQDLLVVDLPSTGHALSFFSSPFGVNRIFSMGFVHKESEKILELFQAPTTRIDLVALPEELPITEAGYLKQKLDSLGTFPLGYLHMNQTSPEFPLPANLPQLPEDVRACVEGYLERREREGVASDIAAELKLPQIPIPRFPVKDREQTLTLVTEFLESA